MAGIESYASLFGMTYITWKERKSNGSLFEKTFSLKSENYHSTNIGYLLYGKYYDVMNYSKID